MLNIYETSSWKDLIKQTPDKLGVHMFFSTCNFCKTFHTKYLWGSWPHPWKLLIIYPILNLKCFEKHFQLFRWETMVAEMLQKYIFIFNIFLSKKPYIFIFNQKIFFFRKNFVIQRKYIYIQLKYIHLFSHKKYIFIQSKKMSSMKYFYSMIFSSQIWSSIC